MAVCNKGEKGLEKNNSDWRSVPELYQNGLCRAALYQKGTAAGALWRLSSHSTRKMPAAAVEERYYTKAVLDLHQKDAGTPTAAQMLTIYTV